MDHPLQRRDEGEASLFASPFAPMEQQLPQNTSTIGEQQQQQQQYATSHLSQQHQAQHTTNNNNMMTRPQTPTHLQHANSMPYSANTTPTTGIAHSTPSGAPIIGPRGKCDQVIYEAMTKACEIVVRGRCTQLELTERMIMLQQQQQQDAVHKGSTTSSSSRFNIQVDEVPSVRSILQTWKRALNIPLRLDIFYEYADPSNNNGGGGGVQRELLERWCIDYKNINSPIPSSSKVMTGAKSTSMNNGNNSSVSQLRLVCKRIVVLLRNLHCMTRMLPAYRLQSLIENSGNGVDGVNTNVMGLIGYSIYASDYEPNGPTLPSPSFTQQTFPSVKTQFGNLGLSVMYDATLNPHQMMEGVIDRLQSDEAVWAQQEHGQQHQQMEEVQQQFGSIDINQTALRSSTPIPVPPEPVSSLDQNHMQSNVALSVKENSVGKREVGSCPATLLRRRSRSSSLGGVPINGGRTRAVSDLIIKDYHVSPAIKPKSSPSVGGIVGNLDEKRVMSGLSLAMMADGGSQQQQQPPPQQQPKQQEYPTTDDGMPLNPDEYSEQNQSSIQPWGSLATRAAFHNPPPTYESPGVDSSGGATNNFFQSHSGYGYGYNGSQVQMHQVDSDSPFPPVGSAGSSRANDGLSLSPSPLMSTPPVHYSSLIKRRQSAAGAGTPSSLKENLGDTQNSSDQADEDENAPPFTNPTMLQALPASSNLSSAPTSPSTIAHASSSVGNSPSRRQSSSSVLLPPVTSLDLLQKSPFTATGGGNVTGRDGESLALPFALGSYRDEMFMSSIPKLVSAGSKSRTSSLAGSTSGTNPFMSSFGQSSAGGYYSTGPFASRREIHGCSQSDAADETEEMPFALALDEDSPFTKSSSRSLLGSTRGDHNGLAVSSLAVSSLHQRCDQGRPRLKMFSSSKAGSSVRNDEGIKYDQDSDTADYASIKDQLSEFRTWHSSSLMVDSEASS